MTLITLRNGDGSSRRCDGKCYDAVNLKCSCMCKALNHGVGLKRAVRNRSLFVSRMLLAAGVEINDVLPLEDAHGEA